MDYFSDGWAAQCKNRKKFYNVCMHSHDFDVKATWFFFATFHGELPCHGIGVTAKCSTAIESLHRPLQNQIRFLDATILHCKEKLPYIPCCKNTKKEIE